MEPLPSNVIKLIIWPNGKKASCTCEININTSTINSIKRLKDALIASPGIRDMVSSMTSSVHIRLYNSKGIELEETDMANLISNSIIFLIDTLSPSSSLTLFNPSNHTNQYTFIKWIKSGGFGKVYFAKHIIDGDEIAIKQISINSFSSEDLYNISRKKVYLDNLSHRNIIKSHSAFYDDQHLYIIMDHAKGGELTEYIKAKGPLSEEDAKRIFKQIYNAVLFVHSRNTIHRDFKPNNILFLDENHEHVVLIDFGICGFSNGNDKEMIKAGTTSYIPPEIASGKEYASNTKLDVWSLGVILYYMIYNQLPFTGKNEEEIIESILTKQVQLQFPLRKQRNISTNCIVLIQKMLEKNVHFRIEMNDEAFEDWFDDRVVEGNNEMIVKSKLFHSPSPKAKGRGRNRNGNGNDNSLVMRKCSDALSVYKNRSVYGKCQEEFNDGIGDSVNIRKIKTMKAGNKKGNGK